MFALSKEVKIYLFLRHNVPLSNSVNVIIIMICSLSELIHQLSLLAATHAASADQDQPAHLGYVNMVCTVCFSVALKLPYFEFFPRNEKWM
jgi:hypothetical protein